MQQPKASSIAILGSGSWGTAVAHHLAKTGHTVLLWGRDKANLSRMHQERRNVKYLPDAIFPDNLKLEEDLSSCLNTCEQIILAVPSHAFHSLLLMIKEANLIKPLTGLSWLTKGLDPSTHQFCSQLVSDIFGSALPMAMISGPSFAKELAQGLPTALCIASNNTTFLDTLKSALHYGPLRVYETQDLLGVQLCGAVKNVLAIACGISDGLAFGANAKAALITRGLAEMRRLGLQMGGREETFRGLAGIGDLLLTCTDNQSRNRRFGLFLGQGLTLLEAEQQITQVIEGKQNAFQVCNLAKQYHIDMPICAQVQAVLEDKTTPKEAATQLMQRFPSFEG